MKNIAYSTEDYTDIGLIPLKIASNMSGKLLRQLSRSLYSHEYSSAFREITANMYDAFRGLDREFKADIEYTSNNKLIFRDYGVGMSHDTVINTYFTKGNTVKSEDEDSLGGFGIGMLSICSISKSSRITTYFEGIKNVYLLLDVTESISFKHISSTQEEGVGTEIVLTLDLSKEKIEKELRNTLHFCEGINYINLNVNNIIVTPPLFENEDFYLLGYDNSLHPSSGVLLNNTLYRYTLTSDDYTFTNVYLKFKASELEPSLNKESLRNTEENTKVIADKRKKVEAFIDRELYNYYVNVTYAEFKINVNKPHLFSKLMHNYKFADYLRKRAADFFIDDKIYLIASGERRKEVTPLSFITDKRYPSYFCDTPTICSKRNAYLNSQKIYIYYLVKGKTNNHNFNIYNNLPRLGQVKNNASSIMSCKRVSDDKTLSINYSTDAVYYYAITQEDIRILETALKLEDTVIKDSNTIKITSDKGKKIVEEYDNFIKASEIVEYNPGLQYEAILRGYILKQDEELIESIEEHYTILSNITYNKYNDVRLPTNYSPFSKNSFVEVEKRLPKSLIEQFEKDMQIARKFMQFFDEHKYLKYLNKYAINDCLIKEINTEWKNYLNSKKV